MMSHYNPFLSLCDGLPIRSVPESSRPDSPPDLWEILPIWPMFIVAKCKTRAMCFINTLTGLIHTVAKPNARRVAAREYNL